MASEVTIQGNVTSLARRLFADGDAQLELTPMGAGLVAFPLGIGPAELTRMGDSWQVASSAGVTALNVLPTTVAGFTMYNGEGPNGKTYVIDSFGFWLGVAQATTFSCTALFAMMNVAPATSQTDALTKRSLVGKTYGGKARVLGGATVTNDGWLAVGTSLNAAAVAAAGSIWKVQESVCAPGLFQIPPGGAFNLHAVSVDVTASSVFFFIRWHETRHGGIVS